MHLMGAIELMGGWHYYSLHVPGVLNDVADGISRWNPGDIRRYLGALHPSIYRLERDVEVERQELCTPVLDTNLSAKSLRERLNVLTQVFPVLDNVSRECGSAGFSLGWGRYRFSREFKVGVHCARLGYQRTDGRNYSWLLGGGEVRLPPRART